MESSKNVFLLGIKKSSKILAIMPHPDDETAFCGGFLANLSRIGCEVNLIVATKGEASTNRFGLKSEDDLGKIRAEEMTKSAKILGIQNLEILDFPDGKVENFENEIKIIIKNQIRKLNPDFVLTLEPWGCYGHPDHVSLSKIVTEAYNDLRSFTMIYVTVSKNFKSKSVIKMAKNPELVNPIKPNFVFGLNWKDLLAKLKSARCHKSQFNTKFLVGFVLKWSKKRMLRKEYFYKI